VSSRLHIQCCKTRRAISFCDFEEAWTSSGLIASTPPLVTKQSTAGTSVRAREFCRQPSTPARWVPGSTRRGPFAAPDSSRCTRNATTRISASAGACAVNDALFYGPRPPSRHVFFPRNAKPYLECHATSQFASADCRIASPEKGTASPPKMSFAISRSFDSFAAAATPGSFIACRTPARLRRREACERSSLRKSKTSFSGIRSGTIAKPLSQRLFKIRHSQIHSLVQLATNLPLICGKMTVRLLLLKNWQELCQGCRVAHAALFLWPGATGKEAAISNRKSGIRNRRKFNKIKGGE